MSFFVVDACACLTDDGDVYAWGSGQYGELGHGFKGYVCSVRLNVVYVVEIQGAYISLFVCVYVCVWQ